ncbi:MAG: hypothetical protein Q7R41_11535, partial [Phycisphaerales bacterium]|nr:hypothetical protein [Phycisphaerales bacterium]
MRIVTAIIAAVLGWGIALPAMAAPFHSTAFLGNDAERGGKTVLRLASAHSTHVRVRCDDGAVRIDGPISVEGGGRCAEPIELEATSAVDALTVEFVPGLEPQSVTIHGPTRVGASLLVAGEIAVREDVRITAGVVVIDARMSGRDISIDALESISVSERAKLHAPGGNIELVSVSQGHVTLAGALDASDLTEYGRGGVVRVMGGRIALIGQARVEARGTCRGGDIRVGQTGEGTDRGPSAARTVVMPGASIRADATLDGDGGTVLFFSENTTGFHGFASARGGADGGNGGFIDVSSRGRLGITGQLHVEAPAGSSGQVLFDPLTVVVYPRSTYVVPPALPGFPPIPGLFPNPVLYDAGWYLTESDPKLLTNVGLAIVEKYLLFANVFRDQVFPYDTPIEDTLTDAILGVLPDPNVQLFEGLDVDYAADNLIIGLIVKIAEYLTGGAAGPLEILGYFHSVSALALEPLQANISVDSFGGIFFLTALVNPFLVQNDPFGFLRPELDLHAQRADATAKFRTLGPIVSLGGINYQGASLELHAGAPFDNDAANGLVAIAASAIPSAGDLIGNIVQHDRFREAVGEFDLRHLTPNLNLLNDFSCCLLGTPNEGGVCLSDLVNGEWCPENYFEDAGLDPYTDLIHGGWTEPFGVNCQDWADAGIFWIDQLALFLSDPEANFRDGYALLTSPPPTGLGLPVPAFIQDAVDALAYVVSNADELIDAIVSETGSLECSDLGVLAQQAVGACNTACTAVSGLCHDACDLVTGTCVVLCNDDLEICFVNCEEVRFVCNGTCAAANNTCNGVCTSARSVCNNGCVGARGVCNSGCDGARSVCRAACEVGPVCGPVCTTCKGVCDSTWSGCRSGCTTTYNGCVGGCTVTYNGCSGACGLTYDGCIGGCTLAYEACTFVDCPTDYDLCFENVCQLECDNCLVDCGGICAQIPGAVAVIEDACETDWVSSLRSLLVEHVIPLVGEKLKQAFGIAANVDASTLISTAVQCPPEPVNMPDFAVTLPINPPLLINGDILRGKGAAKDGGAIILRNGTAGSVAFGGVLEGESVTIHSSTMGLVYHGSNFGFEGFRIGGPIRNAKIILPRLLPEVQPLNFARGNAEIRASTIDLVAAGGIGQITGFGDSGTAHGFLLDLLSAFVPDVVGNARLGTGVEQRTSPMQVFDNVFVPIAADLANHAAKFTYLDGGPIP